MSEQELLELKKILFDTYVLTQDDDIEIVNHKPYLKYNFESCDELEQWQIYCDLCDELYRVGYEFDESEEDVYIEHDCITGTIKKIDEN